MRTFWILVGLTLVGLVSAVLPSHALERTVRPFDGDEEAWSASASCTIRYYNICTGWVTVWGPWDLDARVGVAYEACHGASGCVVFSTRMFVWTGAPSGWGYTGALGVYAADASDCPVGQSISVSPFLPHSGWNEFQWPQTSVPARFAVVADLPNAPHGNPVTLAGDHPAAGPTGPQPCGTCFSIDRVTHSYDWGTPDSPLCPGSPFADDVCNAELLWMTTMSCATDAGEGVTTEPWSRLKHLYR